MLFCFAVLGIGIAAVFLTGLKSDRLEIRDPMHGVARVSRYWTKEVRDKESGVVSWEGVWCSGKIKTEAPPSETLSVDRRGRRYAVAYKVAEGQHVWIKDKGIEITEVEKVIDGIKRKTLEIHDVGKDGEKEFIDTFEPFTVTDRLTVMSEVVKSNEMKAKSWTADKIIAGGSIAIMGLVLILFIVFFGDIMSAVNSHHSTLTSASDRVLYRSEQIMMQQAKLLEALNINDFNITLAQVVTPYQGAATLEGDGEKPPTWFDGGFGIVE